MKDNRISFHNNSSCSSNSNQSQSSFSSVSASQLKGNNSHFQLHNLYKDFNQDELALKEFIEVIETDLNSLSIDLLKAFRQNDLTLYEQVHYKTLAPLKMIHASTLQDLLAAGRDLMGREETSSESTIFRNLEKEFSAVLTSLAALK